MQSVEAKRTQRNLARLLTTLWKNVDENSCGEIWSNKIVISGFYSYPNSVIREICTSCSYVSYHFTCLHKCNNIY